MNVIFLLPAALIFAVSCSSTKNTKAKFSVLTEMGIKGDVQYIKETDYTCDSTGKILEAEECCVGRDEFNEDGNIIRQQITGKNGKPVMDITNTLHENGLRETLTVTKGGKTISFVQNYFTDEGNYARQVIRDSANKIQKYYTILKMNGYGQWVTFIEYDKDSVMVMKEDSEFEKNLPVKAWQTDKAGKTLATYDYKYNDRGNLVEITVVEMTANGQKKTVTKDTYDEYDDKGNWVKRTLWDDKGKAIKVEKREFTYRK
jgi:YD repeat-containing protein